MGGGIITNYRNYSNWIFNIDTININTIALGEEKSSDKYPHTTKEKDKLRK